MPRKDLVRKKPVERPSRDVKSRSNVLQVESVNRKKRRPPKKSIEDNAAPKQQQCVICMDTRRFKIRKKILCGHSFHRNCINCWLQDADTCPICRKSVKHPHDQQPPILGQQPRLLREQQQRQMSQRQQDFLLQRLIQQLQQQEQMILQQIRQHEEQSRQQEIELQRQLRQH